MMAAPRVSFWRVLAAFLALPGLVAFAIPWLIRPPHAAFNTLGLPLLGAGSSMLLWCVRDFYVVGRGSLAPWAPPAELVTTGLYRFTRNPMYVAVLLILTGWALAYGTRTQWIYLLAVAAMFHLRVVFGEEPWLARRHGDNWTAYRARAPRWLFPWPRA